MTEDTHTHTERLTHSPAAPAPPPFKPRLPLRTLLDTLSFRESRCDAAVMSFSSSALTLCDEDKQREAKHTRSDSRVGAALYLVYSSLLKLHLQSQTQFV